MPYVITSATWNPKSQTAHSSVTAGEFMGQTAHLACETDSSLIRAYLHAALDGLTKIENLMGKQPDTLIDVLIPDEQVADRFRGAGDSMTERLLAFDDRELWTRLVARKKDFKINFVSHPDEAASLRSLWLWQRDPSSSMPPGAMKRM